MAPTDRRFRARGAAEPADGPFGDRHGARLRRAARGDGSPPTPLRGRRRLTPGAARVLDSGDVARLERPLGRTRRQQRHLASPRRPRDALRRCRPRTAARRRRREHADPAAPRRWIADEGCEMGGSRPQLRAPRPPWDGQVPDDREHHRRRRGERTARALRRGEGGRRRCRRAASQRGGARRTLPRPAQQGADDPRCAHAPDEVVAPRERDERCPGVNAGSSPRSCRDPRRAPSDRSERGRVSYGRRGAAASTGERLPHRKSRSEAGPEGRLEWHVNSALARVAG